MNLTIHKIMMKLSCEILDATLLNEGFFCLPENNKKRKELKMTY